MKICNNCGNKLSDSEKKCPVCKTNAKSAIFVNDNDTEKINDVQNSVRAKNANAPAKKKPHGCLVAIIVLVIIGAIIGALGGNDSDSDSPAKSSQSQASKTPVEKAMEDAIEVDYNVLHQEYMDNAIAADAKYKGKQLILTGVVADIDREIAGQPYITFDIDFLENIRITFNKSEEEKVAQLSKGQTVKVVGTCQGTLLSTTVALSDCYIIE